MDSKLYVSNRDEWRKWLKKNHNTLKAIWLIYYKKHTGKPRIPYNDAVEEALCFGWIDSIIKKIDDKKYCQKFTPRNDKSIWSEHNKKRVARMIKLGKMTEAGLKKVRSAKKNGSWHKQAIAEQEHKMPSELSRLLEKNKKALQFFNSLRKSSKNLYIGWIASAKKEETRLKRAQEAIMLLKKKQKLGIR